MTGSSWLISRKDSILLHILTVLLVWCHLVATVVNLYKWLLLLIICHLRLAMPWSDHLWSFISIMASLDYTYRSPYTSLAIE